jgi:hypothetical protein
MISRRRASRYALAVIAAAVLPGSLLLAPTITAADPDAVAAKKGTKKGKEKKRKPISGKLSKRGYTVIALAASGKAASVVARRGKFRLRPPADRVTLQLRGADGTYAGPIVAGAKPSGKGKRKGRSARKKKGGGQLIVGVRAGANLGTIKVKAAKGYAKMKGSLPAKLLDVRAWARAKKGVPIGAGVFGFVRSKPPRSSPPADLDADGIPDPLDVDVNGNKVLNNLDRSPAGRGARAAQSSNEFQISTVLGLPIYDTANADAPGFTDSQIEATLPRLGVIGIERIPCDLVELDCGLLVYCSAGGTGRVVVNFNPPTGPPFPGPPGGQFDSDGDGFGTLSQDLSLLHGATSAQIKTGDVLIERATSGGVQSQYVSTVQYVFATAPALVSFSDTAGNSATVSYPVAGYQPGPPGPGTLDNPFPVAPGPDGDVVLTVTLWRPQRKAISGSDPATARWMDIGGLDYTARVSGIGLNCPQGAFSSVDPHLTPTAPSPFTTAGGFTDLATDQPASTANTLTYTLNATQCLASGGMSWDPGQVVGLDFLATGNKGADHAEQGVNFKRQ